MNSESRPPGDADVPGADAPARRSPVPWLVAGFLALLAVMLLVGGAFTDDSDQPVGDPPPEVAFDLLGGGSSSFADHRGTPTIVNFFASWCAPCVRELPDIQAAAVKYDGRLDVVGLSVSDRIEDTEALLVSAGITFEVGLDPDGAIHRAVSDLGVMPTTIFIEADGSLSSVHAGTISADDLDEIIVDQLLADPAERQP